MAYILTEEAQEIIRSSRQLRYDLGELFDFKEQNILKINRLNQPNNDFTKLAALELIEKASKVPFRKLIKKVNKP